MKAWILLMISCFNISSLAAQKASFGLLEKAASLFYQYEKDNSRIDQLRLARTETDRVVTQYPDLARISQAQLLKGRIYEALWEEEGDQDPAQKRSKNGQLLILTAVRAYRAAVELAANETERATSLKRYEANIEAILSSEGARFYDKKDYAAALPYFEEALKQHPILKKNNVQTIISPDEYIQLTHAAATCALKLKQYSVAQQYLQGLADTKMADGGTYELFFELFSLQGKKDEAGKKLNEGMALFPEYPGLVFAAINQLLQQGRISELPPLLKRAITLEPDNHALYHTLGNVYDNLWQQAQSKGQTAEVAAHFTQAETYYRQATEKGSGVADYWYSAGALYYNKAAMVNRQLNQDNLSAQKEEQIISEMKSLFDKALPFFKKAESLAPADINTLIALKTIFERKNDPALYQEFTKRLKTLEAGGKIEKSYF